MSIAITGQVASQLTPSRVFRTLLIVAVGFWLADLAWYQARAWWPGLGQANGSVHRMRLLEIPGKGNKVEYQIDSLQPEEDVPCTRSVFPHAGSRPCWYVSRHAHDPIPM